MRLGVKVAVRCSKSSVRGLRQILPRSWVESRLSRWSLSHRPHVKESPTPVWKKRQTRYGKTYWEKGSKLYQVAASQNWQCPVCGEPLFNGEQLHTHQKARKGSFCLLLMFCSNLSNHQDLTSSPALESGFYTPELAKRILKYLADEGIATR